MKLIICSLSAVLFLGGQAAAQTSVFTYQGRLTDGGAPANGAYDLVFRLFDSSGNPIGNNITKDDVSVSAGVFNVYLDFGTTPLNSVTAVSIEISVRPGASTGSYTPLTPRQPLTSAPYAVQSLHAANASQLEGINANQYVLTTDLRMSDARPPAAGSPNYVQNATVQQASSNFNISGNGTAGTLSANTVNAAQEYRLGNLRILNGDDSKANLSVGSGTGAIGPGDSNVFVGVNAGHDSGGAFFNTFVGANAGISNTSSHNSFFGSRAGFSNSTGIANAFFGSGAGQFNTIGSYNSAFGHESGHSLSLGGFNSFFGHRAGENSLFGSSNSFFGTAAGRNNLGGNGNTFVGHDSGDTNVSGTRNSTIGEAADLSASDLTNATAIGANALVAQSNSLVLGSINGVNGADADVNVGIGIEAPTFKLQVVDSGNTGLRVQTNTAGGTVASFGGAGAFQVDASGMVGGRLQINENGNVGLGTGTPTFKLQVLDSANKGLRVETMAIDGTVASFGGLGVFQVDAPGEVGGRLQINENGNVGLGVRIPASRLDVGGILTVRILGSAGSTSLCMNPSFQIASCSSSARYKTNIQPFDLGLNLIRRLSPITFDWKESGHNDLGLRAEDVAQIEPLLATYNEDGQVEGVKYDRLGVVLINAVKEQQSQIERQQKQIDELKQLIRSSLANHTGR